MDKVAPSKCLFYVTTKIEKLIYSNRTISTLGLAKIGIY